MKDLQALSVALRSARRVVVLTGAGVSAESGIPTFRDALTGLWENYDAQALATAEAFRRCDHAGTRRCHMAVMKVFLDDSRTPPEGWDLVRRLAVDRGGRRLANFNDLAPEKRIPC